MVKVLGVLSADERQHQSSDPLIRLFERWNERDEAVYARYLRGLQDLVELGDGREELST